MLSPLLAMDIGFKQLYRGIKCRVFGVKKYKGDAEEICHQIIEDCWNENYFLGSAGHYSQFWLRDFGMCSSALVKLGYEKEVQRTIENTLNVFKRYNRIATTIIYGKPLNIGYYSPDSLAWLVHAMVVSNYSDHKQFVEKKAHDYFNNVIDEIGLVRTDKRFSALKGGYENQSLFYNNVMTAMLSKDLTALGFDNPFEDIDYKTILKKTFWNGSSFKNDIITDEITGDANIFPYFCNIFNDKGMMKKSINTIQSLNLDKPFPLMYKRGRTSYQVNTVWTQIGPIFIDVVSRVDKNKARFYIEQYIDIIEKYHNYLECFTEQRKPFTFFPYYCDEAMIWAAMFLVLK
ncbi:MAG: hypothetical protein J7K68_04760, partial [Candidatus Diapherotrites archaeon]|nr:hypothetical protein [Candidatus Diapherotrites archaeon]